MEDKLENNRLKYIEYTCERHGIDPDSIEGQLIYYAYGHGYQQAEKDLALTWKDMKLIWNITDEMDNMPEEEFYQEVLKQFNEQRKEK